MRKANVTIGLLVLALVGSNAWWAYQVLDAGVTATYRDAALDDHQEALAQALAILPIVADPEATPEEVLAAAKGLSRTSVSFEKEGFLWIGGLGLKFSPGGRLVEAVPSWSPF